MTPDKKSTQEKQTSSDKKDISIAKIGLISAITVAIIGLASSALNAYFSSQAAQAPLLIPIQATQTAEARVMTQTAKDNFTPYPVTPTILAHPPPSPTYTISALTPTQKVTSCTPAPIAELPPQSIAIVEPLEGTKPRVAVSTLRYEYLTGLNLASGIFVAFKDMMSFELLNPNFYESFDADVIITFLDCRIHNDKIKSESGSYLTGETEIGEMKLHILDVKRVDFVW